MKVTAERQEGEVVLSIQIEPEEVEKAKDRAYRRLVNRYNIPGFRRGKAPRAMLERFIGPTVLLNEALSLVMPEMYDQALKEQEVDAIAEPEMEITSYEPVTVKATVPVRPVVELGDYQSVRVEPEQVTVTDEQVQQTLEQITLERAKWEAVERPVELGDNVIVDIVGTTGDQKMIDQSKVPYLVRAESDQPVPGFAEALVGTEIGQEREICLSFPPDHSVEWLAGKDYVFKATVHQVQGRQLPELNDEFAKGLGLPDVENLEQMRSYLRDALQREADTTARANLEEKILSTVQDMSKIEFPHMLTDRQVDIMVYNQAEQLRRQGIALEQWLKYLGKNEGEMRAELRPRASRLVARELMLQQVIEQEGIEAEEAEIDHLMEHATEEGGEPPNREELGHRIQRLKSVRRLVEIATEGAVSYPSLAVHEGHEHPEPALEPTEDTVAPVVEEAAEAMVTAGEEVGRGAELTAETERRTMAVDGGEPTQDSAEKESPGGSAAAPASEDEQADGGSFQRRKS